MALLYKRVLLAPLVSLSLAAAADTAPLKPEPGQSSVITEILQKLSSSHYRKRAVDDQFSAELYDAYLERLDPWKSYLLKSDLDGFEHWRLKLDDALSKGDISYSFEVFNRYRKIALTQLSKQIALLESDFQFDLSNDEYLVVDQDQRHWPKTDAERNSWWQKRVEYDLLGIMLRDNESVTKAREVLAKRYKNDRARLEELESRDVFNNYAETITRLYDPHTAYFSPRNSENFNINMSLSLEGIGAVLERSEDYIRVVRVVPGGPAAKQGELQVGDKIIGIAESESAEPVDLIGWRLDDAVDLIRGPKNSTAVLQVIPAKASSSDVTSVIKIIRDKVKLEEQAAQKQIVTVAAGDKSYQVGVISIPTFYLDFDAYRNRDPNYKSTSKDVARLMGELVNDQKVDGVILDLRRNGGGSLVEATQLSDMFINPGPVVQIRNSNDKIDRYQRARRPAAYKGPLIVLIDRLSASASEIFAGAIQDYGRGVIVGSQSFGKGTVQTLLPLSKGQLKLTEAKFYRISGESTQHRGVIPDISFPSSEQSGESVYDNALAWDTIPPAPHRSYSDLTDHITTLEQLHKRRAATDPDFTYLKDLTELDQQLSKEDEQQISLKLEARKQMLEKREQQQLSLVNKRRKAKGLELYPDFQAWQDANSEVDSDSLPLAEKDPLLMETSRILADMIQLEQNPQRYAKQLGDAPKK